MIIYGQNLRRQTLKQSLPLLQFPHVLPAMFFLHNSKRRWACVPYSRYFALAIYPSSKPKQSISPGSKLNSAWLFCLIFCTFFGCQVSFFPAIFICTCNCWDIEWLLHIGNNCCDFNLWNKEKSPGRVGGREALPNSKLIVGSHMTSLKFKLKNYRSYRYFTFTMH